MGTGVNDIGKRAGAKYFDKSMVRRKQAGEFSDGLKIATDDIRKKAIGVARRAVFIEKWLRPLAASNITPLSLA